MIELEALNWSFQLLLYIYDMILGMSRADVKNVFLIMHTDSVTRESSLVHNAEFTVDPSPVSNAHSPFFVASKVADTGLSEVLYHLEIRFSDG